MPWEGHLPWDATRTVYLQDWIVRFILIQELMLPCAAPVLERACTHSVGPYCYQNTDIRGFGYYTNKSARRRVPRFLACARVEFALESNINLLAEKVGISPWEIRYRNAIEPGKVLPNGQIADCSTALKETLLAVKDAYESNPGRAGIACAMKNAGVGVGLPR